MIFVRQLTKVLLSATALSMFTGCALLDQITNKDMDDCGCVKADSDCQITAPKAVWAYICGNFASALSLAEEDLVKNPENTQALFIAALAAEQMNNNDKARKYYAKVIASDSKQTSVLGTSDGKKQQITVIAKQRLQSLTIAKNVVPVKSVNGSKNFAVSAQDGDKLIRQTIEKALQQKVNSGNIQNDVAVLFPGNRQYIVARFLILKELAENDFVTKDEFLARRQANLGGLLPLTYPAPGVGLDQPAPSADLIIERMEILKEGTANKAIAPDVFVAERQDIIDALMDPKPRNRMKNYAPVKGLTEATKALRRLEWLYDLGLITEAEKEKEQQAIEESLGIKKAKSQSTIVEQTVSATPKIEQPTIAVETTKEAIADKSAAEVAPLQISAPEAFTVAIDKQNQPLPKVSSPF